MVTPLPDIAGLENVTGINYTGQVVGNYHDERGSHGFLYERHEDNKKRHDTLFFGQLQFHAITRYK